MTTTRNLLTVFLLAGLMTIYQNGLAAPAAPESALNAPRAPALQVQVDPRVELLSLVFRLAGNSEYSQGKVDSYTADAEKQFGRFREHRAVKFASELRQRCGVSFDACMSMAVHLTNVLDLSLVVPLEPWPDGLDRRWKADDVKRFIEAVREFVRDSSFGQFLEQHRRLYETTEARARALMAKEAHLEWFNEYFGERPQATFTLAPALFNGGCCYGSHCRDARGKEQLYCILGVWKTDPQGLPEFTHDMIGTVVHEFGHSYANPMMDQYQGELAPAAGKLFERVAGKMRSQAYGDARTMLRESLVRVCEVRYASRYDGPQAAQRAIKYNQDRGFLWTGEFSNLLADYEAHRDQYPTLAAFSPRFVTFFKNYADNLPQKDARADARKPRIKSMIPSNGATDVDPSLTCIKVVFDRPMKDGSWALVGGGPHCPETTGKASYDAKRTTWSVPVKLKSDWSYQFMLNSEAYEAFQSQDGAPLEPVNVSFQTRKAKAD